MNENDASECLIKQNNLNKLKETTISEENEKKYK